jgi:hypothetical protein
LVQAGPSSRITLPASARPAVAAFDLGHAGDRVEAVTNLLPISTSTVSAGSKGALEEAVDDRLERERGGSTTIFN